MQARTIQIFLPEGNPREIRNAEITSQTVQVIQAPRAHVDQAWRADGWMEWRYSGGRTLDEVVRHPVAVNS